MTTTFRLVLLSTALALCVSTAAFAQDAGPASRNETPKDVILILDASGSMWGQIDGINKIVIAKDVVEGLVRAMPSEQRLGMVAYGHRKKGDCSDIETIADVGSTRADVIKRIRELSPKGKTPLSKSVEHAATELNYTKTAATVILVSDGLETCDVDPCALAKLLEENGLDFTVHVVGFDVTQEEREGLVCIAQETGGQFLAADNADELTDALVQVAMIAGPVKTISAQAASPLPQEVALRATILKGGPHIQSDLNWLVVNRETGDAVFEKEKGGYVEFEVVPGDYTATAVWTGWPHQDGRYKGDKTGSLDFTIVEGRPVVHNVPIDLDIPVRFEADTSIAEGRPVNVTWSGPDDLGVTISTNALDDSPREQIYFASGQPARDAYEKQAKEEASSLDTNGDGKFDQDDIARTAIGGPSYEGNYEVRYTLNSPRVILARVPLAVTDSSYTVSAPDEVPAASQFDVEWSGLLTPGDMLFIEKADLKSAYYKGPRVRLKEGMPAEITAPVEPGDYEIRYVMNNGYTTYPGMQHAVQARRPIKVVVVEAAIDAPSNAVGGSTIVVQIETPDSWEDDMISVIESGASKSNSDARFGLSGVVQDDGSFQIRVPAIAGDYEIAYFLNPGSRVIARKPLRISAAEASVDAPATVKAGTDFDVSYTGEVFDGDRIIICPADTPDQKMWGWTANYGFFAKEGETTGTVRGGFKAAKEPGEYEARYVTGLQHQVLARDKFTVTE